MLEDALAHLEAAERLATRPVENAVQVAALAEFEQDLGDIFGRARLRISSQNSLGRSPR